MAVEQIAEEPARDTPEQLTVDFTEAAPEAEQAPVQAVEATEAAEPVAEAAEAVEPEINTKAAQVLEEIADSQSDVPRVKAKSKKPKSRSRVGSMFDLLTFNDV